MHWNPDQIMRIEAFTLSQNHVILSGGLYMHTALRIHDHKVLSTVCTHVLNLCCLLKIHSRHVYNYWYHSTTFEMKVTRDVLPAVGALMLISSACSWSAVSVALFLSALALYIALSPLIRPSLQFLNSSLRAPIAVVYVAYPFYLYQL